MSISIADFSAFPIFRRVPVNIFLPRNENLPVSESICFCDGWCVRIRKALTLASGSHFHPVSWFVQLTSMLKEQAVPALYQAYKDTRITNVLERARVLSSAMNYVGSSQTANDLFKEVIGNEAAGQGRFFIIGQLDNGNLSPQIIRQSVHSG